MMRVPVDDDGSEQVEASHAIVLSLCGAVADFSLSPDPEGVFRFKIMLQNI